MDWAERRADGGRPTSRVVVSGAEFAAIITSAQAMMMGGGDAFAVGANKTGTIEINTTFGRFQIVCRKQADDVGGL